MKDSNPKISVFVPVYNGSAFLDESVKTILNQTYQDFELLFVDDSSTDNSVKILKKFSTEDTRIRIFEKVNGGIVPISWNFILPFMRGEFVFYMSQDDLLSPDLFAKMIETQIRTNCDTVLPDMVFYNGLSDDKVMVGLHGVRDKVIDGKSATEYSLDWDIHGFALRKKSLFDDEIFPTESFNSDEFMTRKLFHKSCGVAFSEGTFFYRQDNNQAITKTFSKKNYFTLLTLLRLFNFLRDNNYSTKLSSKILNKLIRSTFTYTALSQNNFGLRNDFDRMEIKKMLSGITQDVIKIKESKFYNELNFIDKTQLNIKLGLVESLHLKNFIVFFISLKYRFNSKLVINE